MISKKLLLTEKVGKFIILIFHNHRKNIFKIDMKKILLFSFLLLTSRITFTQDHTENVSGPYDTPSDVTAECLMCHEDAGEELVSLRWHYPAQVKRVVASAALGLRTANNDTYGP